MYVSTTLLAVLIVNREKVIVQAEKWKYQQINSF